MTSPPLRKCLGFSMILYGSLKMIYTYTFSRIEDNQLTKIGLVQRTSLMRASLQNQRFLPLRRHKKKCQNEAQTNESFTKTNTMDESSQKDEFMETIEFQDEFEDIPGEIVKEEIIDHN